MEKKLFLLVFSLLCVGILHAALLNVPTDYATIQSGIDSSTIGDTVLVQPGTYIENINYIGKNITVASLFLTTQDTSYISQTLIDGDSLGAVVTFVNGEDSTAVLKGFSITRGLDYTGGGINCLSSSPSLSHLKIFNNMAKNGAGVSAVFSDPTFQEIKVYDNTALEYGGGIYLAFSESNIEHATVSNNTAKGGAGMHCYEASPIINRVLIADNDAELYGGGFLCYFCSSPSVVNVTITNNQCSGNGAGIYTGNYSYPHFNNCIISDNNGNYGVYNCLGYPGTPNITYSDIWNNQGGNFYNCDPGIGCIAADPLFIDSVNEDYHLGWEHFPVPDQTMSPCIDSGDPNSPPDPDGTVADMGAYYFNQNASVDDPEDYSGCIMWNFPNPTKNATTIKYSLKQNSHVIISIYNIKGQLVSTLVNETKPKGEYSVMYDTEALSSGVYFYKIQAGDISEIRKMIVIR
ncbi:MAG: T9SS type A sorting domain-containing protein [Candidatus Cloacimonetes bacterium]|nr:T9SS type A sorting domain-containing protein [Candidatus Cloacimonadota bacterium]